MSFCLLIVVLYGYPVFIAAQHTYCKVAQSKVQALGHCNTNKIKQEVMVEIGVSTKLECGIQEPKLLLTKLYTKIIWGGLIRTYENFTFITLFVVLLNIRTYFQHKWRPWYTAVIWERITQFVDITICMFIKPAFAWG